MKILFLFKNENFLAPSGLCCISAAAVKDGHQTYICDVNSEDALKSIVKIKPEMVAYSSSTGEAKHYFKLNKLIKTNFPGIFTLMGGPHPTFYPEVIQEGDLDGICVGEGERAFVDLLNALSAKKPLDNIPNIVIRNSQSQLVIRDLIEDLDTLPFPDYGLLYDNTVLGSYPLKSFITSRGCPYDCTYCFNHAWRKIYHGKGETVRRHSVDYVLDEIRQVKKKWPLSFIKFYDDIFTYGADNWLEEFCRKYKSLIGLPFFILTRADLLTEDVVRLLKDAGCRTISMSIESGNPEIRSNLLRRKMSDEEIIKAYHLCEKYGIYTFANSIIGLPGAGIAQDIESLDLTIQAKATWAEFPIFYPYPKLELTGYAVKSGFYLPNYEQMHTSYMHRSLLNCFSEKEKNIQVNLSALAPIAVVYPKLRNLIVRKLINLPNSVIFTFLYYLVKMRVFRKKLYVTKTSRLNSLMILIRSLKQEFFGRQDKRG
jgi:anaerobic magnesium-protoporphyrin IX monomethyl ester cyclase